MEVQEININKTNQDYIDYVTDLMNKNVKVSHTTKGGVYTIEGFVKMKAIEDGSWHISVIYSNSNKEQFVREIGSFIDNFIELDEITNKAKVRDLTICNVKRLRVQLNQTIEDVKNYPKSREISLAIIKLQEARMWLGEELRRLDDKYPYPNSVNPSNTIIDPPADTHYGSDYDLDKSKLTPP